MACRLFGTKTLPEPMLVYCQLDSEEQVSMKFEFEFYNFHSRNAFARLSAKMVAILSRGRLVNKLWSDQAHVTSP